MAKIKFFRRLNRIMTKATIQPPIIRKMLVFVSVWYNQKSRTFFILKDYFGQLRKFTTKQSMPFLSIYKNQLV